MSKILIIDDEESILKALTMILRDEGHTVRTAPDGRSGWEAFLDQDPDVVFCDVWLPEMDGLELLGRIKARNAAAMVIMISGHGTISTAVQAVKSGAFDFIEKPLSMDAVLLSLKKAEEFQSLLRTNQTLKNALKLKEELEARPPEPPDLEREFAAQWKELKGATRGTQKTLAKSVVLYGVGLHSGARTGLILQPLPPGSGIHFIALPSGADIPAHLSHVVSGGFATTLGTDGVTVKTVEHFLAACHAFGITNLLVKVQGEIPVMDGSSVEFCKIFLEAGIEDQGASIPPVVVRREHVLGSPEPGKKCITVRPCDHLRISYHLSYPPPVGDEDYTFDLHSPEDFVREIAPARTFGFMRDIHELEKMGLGSGGRLNNFILIGEDGVLNTTLRFPKEFARHKILDILGDFYLMGRPFLGEIRASLTGHTENQAMLREIAKEAGQ